MIDQPVKYYIHKAMQLHFSVQIKNTDYYLTPFKIQAHTYVAVIGANMNVPKPVILK